jgi:hypothetical protein
MYIIVGVSTFEADTLGHLETALPQRGKMLISSLNILYTTF